MNRTRKIKLMFAVACLALSAYYAADLFLNHRGVSAPHEGPARIFCVYDFLGGQGDVVRGANPRGFGGSILFLWLGAFAWAGMRLLRGSTGVFKATAWATLLIIAMRLTFQFMHGFNETVSDAWLQSILPAVISASGLFLLRANGEASTERTP